MTNTKKTPHFIPLSPSSQSVSENVLYYDASASMDALYECANARLKATINLLDALHSFKGTSPDNAATISIVANFLLSDADTLFEKLSGMALTFEKKQQ